MSLTNTFNLQRVALHLISNPKRRPAPFSIRLSESERARLVVEAAGAPLGSFIKSKVLGTPLPTVRVRRTGLAVEDRKALAQVLALLGRSRLANNLNQLAYLANVGALPFTPEIEAELAVAVSEIRNMRRLLLVALGMKAEVLP